MDRQQQHGGHSLEIKDLTKSFVIDGRVHPVFRQFDLDIERGEFVVIVGESGSGKTTLLRIIAGLETADRGSVAVNGKVIAGVGSERVVVFQEPRLLPWLTVRKNVSFGLELRGRPREAISRKVDDALRLVGLGAFASAYPGQSSGYIVDTLQTVLHFYFATSSFADCVIQTVNQGGDSDTTGALAAMLAGATYGMAAIPDAWRAKLDRAVTGEIGRQVPKLLAIAADAAEPQPKSQ